MFTVIDFDRILDEIAGPIEYDEGLVQKKTKDGLEVKLVIPGIEKDDLVLETQDRMIRLSAAEGKTFDFMNYLPKTIRVASGYDTSKTQAKLRNGVLTLNIPFSESHKVQKVNIE